MNLKKREDKIKEKRKQTPWRDFVKEVASWYPFVFYKKDKILSRYHPENGRGENIVSLEEYYKNIDSFSDKYNKNYSGNFFEDLKNLMKIAPLCAIKNVGENPNSYYGDIVFFSKNVYLSSVALNSENVLYSFQTKDSKNVYNSVMTRNGSDNVYFSRNIFESYNIFYSSYIRNSSDVWFSNNLIGCRNCINCKNLENQSFCIENKKLSEEEYKKQKTEILKEKNKFVENYELILLDKGKNIGGDVGGQGNVRCKNIENAYWCLETENGKNLFLVGGKGTTKNMYDVFSAGMEINNDFYGVMGAGYHTENIYCSAEVAVNSSYCYYSYFLEGCSYCLGCVGLKNKQFCILNKQYTKEERFEKANEIFEQMEKDGVLGQFFPGWMNPFYFNDTAAYLIDDSFTKEEVEAEGYLRRDEEIKVDIPEGAEVVETKDLEKYEGRRQIPPTPLNKGGDEPETNGGIEKERRIDPEIMKKVIRDEKGNCYKIVKMEYDFLVKHGLPLPRLHWLDRIKLGFKFK